MEECVTEVKYLRSETRGRNIAFYFIVIGKPAFLASVLTGECRLTTGIGIFGKEQKKCIKCRHHTSLS